MRRRAQEIGEQWEDEPVPSVLTSLKSLGLNRRVGGRYSTEDAVAPLPPAAVAAEASLAALAALTLTWTWGEDMPGVEDRSLVCDEATVAAMVKPLQSQREKRGGEEKQRRRVGKKGQTQIGSLAGRLRTCGARCVPLLCWGNVNGAAAGGRVGLSSTLLCTCDAVDAG
jgi:hypothetical protein